MNSQRAITARIKRSDHLRRSPASVGGPTGHKEWTHFCVFGPSFDLLVNFNLSDGVRTGERRGLEVPRVIVMARDESGWQGEVSRWDGDARFRGGAIDLRFGPNEIRFENGRYHLHVETSVVSCDASFTPLTTPGFTDSIPIGGGTSIKWLVVPRMHASGKITILGRTYTFDAVPAYHDHNWGQFGWGDDFAWEWAIALPADTTAEPWALVYTRLSDRGRLRTFSEGLLVWRNDLHYRTFRGLDLDVLQHGLFRADQPFRLPPVLNLACPGTACDLPRQFSIAARSGDDRLDLDMQVRDFAQILVPNDGPDLGTTVLTEAPGSALATGTLRGEPVMLDGPCLLEVIHGEC